MSLPKLAGGILANVACFGVPLFASAGTFAWSQAWTIVGLALAGAIAAIAGPFRLAPDLVAERSKGPIQAGQPVADRITTAAIIGAFFGSLIASGLDVFRFHFLPPPPAFVSWLGLAAFVGGYAFEFVALRENAFATAVVRLQQERGQRVVDTGLYAIVRHPMYAAALPLIIGIPLWLQSYAGALVAALIVPICMVRIGIEEGLLHRDLPGYDDYARRVRYRLIPYVW